MTDIIQWPICKVCGGMGEVEYDIGLGLCIRCNGIGRLDPILVNKGRDEFNEDYIYEIEEKYHGWGGLALMAQRRSQDLYMQISNNAVVTNEDKELWLEKENKILEETISLCNVMTSRNDDVRRRKWWKVLLGIKEKRG